jgi:hypothetical protein
MTTNWPKSHWVTIEYHEMPLQPPFNHHQIPLNDSYIHRIESPLSHIKIPIQWPSTHHLVPKIIIECRKGETEPENYESDSTGEANNNMWIKSAVLDVNPMVFRRKLPFFTPANQPVNHREITTKSPLNYHWILWNQVLRESPEAALALLRGCTTERMLCPFFLGGRSQGVFPRWFDLWESIGIHGILMGFWWDFHGTWWDFDGLSWDFIIRILARALDYVNSSKFGIWSLKEHSQ